ARLPKGRSRFHQRARRRPSGRFRADRVRKWRNCRRPSPARSPWSWHGAYWTLLCLLCQGGWEERTASDGSRAPSAFFSWGRVGPPEPVQRNGDGIGRRRFGIAAVHAQLAVAEGLAGEAAQVRSLGVIAGVGPEEPAAHAGAQ